MGLNEGFFLLLLRLQLSPETLMVLEGMNVNQTYSVKEMKNEESEKSSHEFDSSSRDSNSSQQKGKNRGKRDTNSLIRNSK